MQHIQPRRLVLARGRGRDPDVRVAQQDPDQLARRVSRRPHDRHADFCRHVTPRSGLRAGTGPADARVVMLRHSAASIQESHATLEIAAPSATSRASYSNRNVQRPDAGTARRCQPPCCDCFAERRQNLAVNRRPVRPGRSTALVHCGSASCDTITQPGSSDADGNRPFLGSRRFGRQWLRVVEGWPGCRGDRPTSRPASLGSGIALKWNEPGPGRAILGPPDRERARPGTLVGDPRCAEEPTGQRRVVDRFSGSPSRRSTCSLRFSIGSKTTHPRPGRPQAR